MVGQQQKVDNDDVISLVDIWQMLVTHRKLFFIINAFVILSGVLYLTFTPSIYEAKAIIKAPDYSEVQSLMSREITNLLEPQVINPKTLFLQFRQSLLSRSEQRNYLENIGLSKNLNGDELTSFIKIGLDRIANDMKIEPSKLLKKAFVITLTGLNKIDISNFVNNFIKYVNSSTALKNILNLDRRVKVRIATIKKRIEIKRKIAKQHRLARVKSLHEVLEISKQSINRGRPKISKKILEKNSPTLIVDIKDIPVYYLQPSVLESEIQILKQRKNDDASIADLQSLQEELFNLESIYIDNINVQTVSVDQEAIIPALKIEPRPLFVVGISLVISIILGFFVVFFFDMILKVSKGS